MNKENKTHSNSNCSIDILKNKNTSSFHNFDYDNSLKDSRFFNIGQADNFSIFNSYETLLKTNQKFTNDFFAESDVSFKNSFLKNMKNKTTFRNMRIIKNSFSQSTIHVNDFNPEISKSNFCFYRNSMENINFNNNKKTGLSLKSNTNYNQYNILKKKLFNKNNDIFDIDEEKDFEEGPKNKTMNKRLLNHLNKDSFSSKLSEKTLNKRKLKLELNLDDPNSYMNQILNKDTKSKIYQDQDENHIINNDDIHKTAEGFEIFPTERLTEKSAEYKVVTTIIENIKLLPNKENYDNDFHEDKQEKFKKQKINEEPKDIEKQNNLSTESNNLNLKSNNRNNLEKEGRNMQENRSNEIQNKNMLLTPKDDLIKKIKNNNGYKVDNLIMQRLNNRQEKSPKKKELGDSVDSKDSLFQTKVLKFNLKKNSNSPFKKKNSDNVIGSSIKENHIGEAVSLNKIPYSINPKFQIHQNYNLSIINRRERVIKKNENFQNNKSLINSLPEIFFNSNKRKLSKDTIVRKTGNSGNIKRTELKSHDRYSIDIKNKLFEENKKLPEFSVINYENKNVILKNKLDYTRDETDFNKNRFPKPLTRNGTIELKNLFADSSFNLKLKNSEDVNLNLNFYSRNINNLSNRLSCKNRNYLQKHFENNEEVKESVDKKKKNNLRKAHSKKLRQAGSVIIKNMKSDVNNAYNSNNKGIANKNSFDKNHFKAQNHAVLKAFAEVQKENLELIEKKINEYVFEYNKRFVDLSFKKKENKFIETDEYKENLRKMITEILKINP